MHKFAAAWGLGAAAGSEAGAAVGFGGIPAWWRTPRASARLGVGAETDRRCHGACAG